MVGPNPSGLFGGPGDVVHELVLVLETLGMEFLDDWVGFHFGGRGESQGFYQESGIRFGHVGFRLDVAHHGYCCAPCDVL